MSNIGSSAMTTAKQKTQKNPNVPAPTAGQQQFNQGTMNMLDEARAVVENAVGQGQQLNPLIYQMLGLDPQYEDHSGDLTQAQSEMDAAQKQHDEASKTIDMLKSIPAGKRSTDQKHQLRQLSKQLPQMTRDLQHATDSMGRVQTMPKTITGFNRLNPSDIPKESPFSANNGLNQAQASETARLNEYLSGKAAVDPTLVHQYDQAESALRAKLAQRFGPDFESSSVGQMALQNFMRQKNEAFATWNQQQVANYNNLAFSGQANLQNLLSQRIGMMQEPSQNQINEGNAISNLAGQRLSQQQTNQQWLLGRAGVTQNTVNSSPAPLIGGIGSLLTTPYTDSSGKSTTLGGQAVGGVSNAASGLYNWATGGGGAAAGGGGSWAPTSDFATGTGAGMSSAAGADAAGAAVGGEGTAALL